MEEVGNVFKPAAQSSAQVNLRLQAAQGMNPELLRRRQMDAELQAQNPINQLEAQYEKLIRIAELQQINIMKSIHPIDDIEAWLGRGIEYLFTEREVIRCYLDPNSKITSLEALNESYLQRLQQLREDTIQGYKERLKSRDYIFENGGFVKLDAVKREQLLSNFIVELEGKLEKYHQNFLAVITENLVAYEMELNDLIEEKKRYLNQLIERKTPLAEQYLDVDKRLAKLQNDARKAILGQRTATDKSLPSLCFNGDFDGVKNTVEVNVKLVNRTNSLGELPLHRACEGAHPLIVNYLLAKGAKPELLDDTKGQLSAYHYACMSGDTNILEVFFRRDGESCLKILGKSNRTLLHSTVFANQPLVLEWLVGKNVFARKLIDINAKDTFLGFTALHITAWLGYPQMARRLLELGANISVENNLKERPLLTALFNRRAEILIVFQENGFCLKPEEINVAFNYVKAGDNRRPENNRLFAQTLHAANQRFQSCYHDPLFRSAEQKEIRLRAIDAIYKLNDLPAGVVDVLINALHDQGRLPRQVVVPVPLPPTPLEQLPQIGSQAASSNSPGLPVTVLPASWMSGPLNSATAPGAVLPTAPAPESTGIQRKPEATEEEKRITQQP